MKKKIIYWINTRDKTGLLLSMMRYFSNIANISFEGSLDKLSLNKISGSKTEETEVLKRATLAPELDFVIVPLTDENIKFIWHEILEKDHLANDDIIHVQIEKDGKIVFGAYDNFHKDCVVAYEEVQVSLLDKLVKQGTIRNYTIHYE
ncbi:MAG: hypothetical protein M5U17_05805 [Ignavibacterium sp.]|nr:hypothetical protein [Ignavibacterium sp.]